MFYLPLLALDELWLLKHAGRGLVQGQSVNVEALVWSVASCRSVFRVRLPSTEIVVSALLQGAGARRD